MRSRLSGEFMVTHGRERRAVGSLLLLVVIVVRDMWERTVSRKRGS